jgi:hypothetical protein
MTTKKTNWFVTRKPKGGYVLYDFARSAKQAKDMLKDLEEGSPIAHRSKSEGGLYNIYVKEGSPLWMKKGGEITIEGNPYKNQDFFIYRNGKEVVSWNADEIAEDEFSEETAQLMYDLYNKDKKELSKRLDKISYAKGGGVKTNSKSVREAIRKEILDSVYDENEEEFDNFNDAAQYLADEFKRVADYPTNMYNIPNNQDRFQDYLAGLPFRFEYENYKIEEFLNGLGINPKGKKYTSDQMQKLYSYLIWREISDKYNNYAKGGSMARGGEVEGTYGGSKTETTIYTYEERGGTWYVADGSVNVNFTYDTIDDGVDIEELTDEDMFTASSPIESVNDLENAVDSDEEDYAKGGSMASGGEIYTVNLLGQEDKPLTESMMTAKNLTELKKKVKEKYGTTKGFRVTKRSKSGAMHYVNFEDGGSTYAKGSTIKSTSLDEVIGSDKSDWSKIDKKSIDWDNLDKLPKKEREKIMKEFYKDFPKGKHGFKKGGSTYKGGGRVKKFAGVEFELHPHSTNIYWNKEEKEQEVKKLKSQGNTVRAIDVSGYPNKGRSFTIWVESSKGGSTYKGGGEITIEITKSIDSFDKHYDY